MIRSEHAIVHYDFRRMTASPDRLQRRRDADYLPIAQRLIELYRDGVGRQRQALHRDVAGIMAELNGCPPRRVHAFCKLLDDAATYHNGSSAAKFRQAVFAAAAPFHPIVDRREAIFEHERETVRKRLAEQFNQPWESIAAKLFSDVIELQTLVAMDEKLQATELLSRYNLAQTQAMLFQTVSAELTLNDDFRIIVGAIKLAGLMHQIQRVHVQPPRYRILLDGPQSNLRETTRYGIRFAQVLTTLVRCRGWQLTANIRPRTFKSPTSKSMALRCHLSDQDGLKSDAASPSLFDSQFEKEIDDCWRSAPVAGWTFTRETDLLCQGQTVYAPDFCLRSDDRVIYVEVVGFWTPEYLTEKLRRLSQFAHRSACDRRCASWLLIFAAGTAPKILNTFSELDVKILIWKKGQDPSQWLA